MSRLLRVVATLVLLALAFAPWAPASAAPQTTQVDSSAEAWYRDAKAPVDGAPDAPELPDPCTLPTGCPAGPVDSDALTTAAFPNKTLHVESVGGQMTAHAYVTPDLTYLPLGAKVLGGVLTLPLNQEQNSGNANVDAAHLVGCLTTEPVTDDVYGHTGGKAPAYDCRKVSQAARLVKKQQVFTLRLDKFTRAWGKGTPDFGVALVPRSEANRAKADKQRATKESRAAKQQSDDTGATWHLSFNGDENEKGKPLSAEVSFTVPQPDAGGSTTTPTTTTPGAPLGGTAGGAPPVTAPQQPQPAGQPPTQGQPGRRAQSAPYALLNSPWYTYRGVVFLPLALLTALSLAGRSLTRPLSRG